MPTIVEETKERKEKKAELLLDSLEIKGYRCFEHLTIEKLGRVNLIVGKNNVGKTALLEALNLYISPSPDMLFDNLLARNESVKIPSNSSIEPYIKFTRHLFFNRPKLLYDDDSARFEIDSPKLGKIFVDSYPQNSSFNYPRFQVKGVGRESKINNYFIGVNGMNSNEASSLWDNITLTELQEPTVNILRIISPQIIDINFIVYPKEANNRIPLAKIEKSSEPIPLRSLGEGMNRLLSISLALANCKDGILLIDEIESGLHYSVLPDVWKLIFKTAKDLNVQVFATTHSKDCIEAFAQAAIDDEESEGNLIRLARKGDEIKAFTFDEKQLETITKEHIEVR